ncbi:MAG: hypothetical protein GXO69_06985 [Acidobacteria bacterium]|nr:hypothetical protein [Acidobacteriota bacterium]
MEQTILVTESELQLFGMSGTVFSVPLGGALDPLAVDHPVRDGEVFRDALASVGKRLNRRKGCRVLLPDSLVFAKVLSFDHVPFSLKRRDEMIKWKMDAFLPGRVDLFHIQYDVWGDSVLVAAMAKTALAELVKGLSQLNAHCFSMLPESFFYANIFLEQEKFGSALLLVNRNRHFSGLVLEAGRVAFVRFRKKIKDVGMARELEMLSEMTASDLPDRRLLFGEPMEIEGEVIGNRWLQ